MSTDASDEDRSADGAGLYDLGLEVPEADAAEQSRSLVDDPTGVDREMRLRGGGPLDRVTDPLDPINPADAADQSLQIDDDEGYDDRR
jgi:hypothetical protein